MFFWVKSLCGLVGRSQSPDEVCCLHLHGCCDELDKTDQPKKLTKGRVMRRRGTSSLATFDHSCVINALLEMVNGALN
jgi:hypothetical protein